CGRDRCCPPRQTKFHALFAEIYQARLTTLRLAPASLAKPALGSAGSRYRGRRRPASPSSRKIKPAYASRGTSADRAVGARNQPNNGQPAAEFEIAAGPKNCFW